MLKLKRVAIVGLILLLAVIIFQNSDSVQTRILFFSVTMPQALLLFLTATTGMFIGVTMYLYFKRD